MITPLIVLFLLLLPLTVGLTTARLRRSTADVQQLAAYGLGLSFLFFATGHFARTHAMVEMLPPWVPARDLLVYASGLLEIAIGFTLFSKRFQQRASLAAIATLVAFFPANVYAAWHGVGMGGHQWGPVYLLIRAPLQVLLIGWALFCLKASARTGSNRQRSVAA